MADDAVALGIKPYDSSQFTNTLGALSSFAAQSAHTGFLSTEAELNQRRLNALDQYGKAYSAGDPDAAKYLAQFPEIQSQALQSQRLSQQYKALDQFSAAGGGANNMNILDAYPDARDTIARSLNTMTEQQKTQANFAQDQIARTAWGAKNSQQWDQGIDSLLSQGVITPEIAQQYRGKYSPTLRDQVIDHAMNMRDILETHGVSQGAAAKATLPYTIRAEQARPVGVGPNEGIIIPNGMGSGGGTNSTPGPQPGANSNNPLNTAGQGNRFYSEIPEIPLPSSGPQAPGTVVAPKGISQIAAEQSAVENAKKIDADAQTATDIRGKLASLKATLDNGFETDASAPARAVVSAWSNALLGKDAAKAISGIDPAQADVFNKEATRLGLEYARATEGSRESMMAIKTALGGNPQLAATTEGNKTIVNMMDQSAKWDQDKQAAKDAYFMKNHHYVGFDSWWNNAHPVSEYISRAMPFPVPTDSDGKVNAGALKPGTTYNVPGKGAYTYSGNNQFQPLDTQAMQ